MTIHVHVCNSETDAQTVIETEKQRGANVTREEVICDASLKVYDHTGDLSHPTQLAQGQCVAIIELS